MNVYFPRIDDCQQLNSQPLPIAPEAIAFQTFKADQTARDLIRSRPIERVAQNIGERQVYAGTAVSLETKDFIGEWIAYPFLIDNTTAHSNILVWRDADGQHRHVRVFGSNEAADRDNALLKLFLNETNGATS